MSTVEQNNETHLPWPLIDFALDTSDNPGAFLCQAAVADWRTVISNNRISRMRQNKNFHLIIPFMRVGSRLLKTQSLFETYP